MAYFDSLNEITKKYFKILANNHYPDFIDKYIELPELRRLQELVCFVVWTIKVSIS
jgi:hypothetical protein